MTPGDMERVEQDQVIQRRLSKIRRKILVMSGKGGVGKSTVAAYLALLLSDRGRKVGLLDVDLHGPTIPHLLNLGGGLEIAGPGRVKPCPVSETLSAVSLEMVIGDKDAAVIWRGPLKIGAIRQFISDIEWGEMDYLIIDAPPGTGDEPLTVAQIVPDAEALLVTTPQEIALADVRKSINFCRQVKIRILGVVENMSGLVCPHCEQTITVFGAGGGARTASQMEVPILGEIPVDPQMVDLGDRGRLVDLVVQNDLPINKAYMEMVHRIEQG
jgi:Mrp family chromosome partitioning ATPase